MDAIRGECNNAENKNSNNEHFHFYPKEVEET